MELTEFARSQSHEVARPDLELRHCNVTVSVLSDSPDVIHGSVAKLGGLSFQSELQNLLHSFLSA